MHQSILRFLTFLLLPLVGNSAILYVKSDAMGNNSGTSWANAYQDLQSALGAAVPGDTIWVAVGTYKPTSDFNRAISFNMKSDVAIYGGFAGSETLLSARNVQTNPTILSGDLNGDDNANFTNYGDNSYHVLRNNNVANARLDGFTITGANADGPGLDAFGGGMLQSNSSPTLQHLKFIKNKADRGGALYNHLGSNSEIKQCLFQDNYALVKGGAMCNEANAIVHQTVFVDNVCDVYAGAAYNNSYSNPRFVNCLFIGNRALLGGAFYNEAYSRSTVSISTFTNNIATADLSCIYTDQYATMYVNNSILWNGTSSIFNQPGPPAGQTFVSYSDVEGGYAGTGNLNADPLFTNAADPDGLDNVYATADDGLRLQCSSPVVNIGNNDSIIGINEDLISTNRIAEVQVDLGAYESSSTCPQPATALDFDGIDDLASANVFSTLVDNMTLQARVNWKGSNGNNQLIVLNGNTTLNGYGIYIDATSDFIKVILGGVLILESTEALTVGQWHDLSLVRKAGVWELYKDGNAVALTSSSSTPLTPTGVFCIGANHVGTESFNGSMDELRFWNRALCQHEIQQRMNCQLSGTETNLLAYYNFNQGIASQNNVGETSLQDASSGSHALTLSNFSLFGTTSNWIAPSGSLSSTCGRYSISVVNPVDVCINENTQIVCASSGATYQWQLNTGSGFNTLVGETNDSLFIYNATLGMSGFLYRCIVSGNACVATDTSNAASLTVHALPTVTASCNPSSKTVCHTATTTLSGGGAATYSWTDGVVDNTPFIAATTQSYVVTGTDAFGCTNSASITVTVVKPVSPAVSKVHAYRCGGGLATFHPTAGGPYYRWTQHYGGDGVCIRIENSAGIYYDLDANGEASSSGGSGASTGIVGNFTGPSTITSGDYADPRTDTPFLLCEYHFINNNMHGVRVVSFDSLNGAACYSPKGLTLAISKDSIKPILLGDDVSICAGSSVQLVGSDTAFRGVPQWSWSPPLGLNTTTNDTVIASPTVTTTYVATKTDTVTGCFRTDTIRVLVNCTPTSEALDVGNQLQVFPNPSTGEVRLLFEAKDLQDLSLKVTDARGQLIYTEHRKKYQGQYVNDLHFNNLPKGIYYLSLSTEHEVYTRKIVTE